MMAQSRAESTRDIYRKYINDFPPNMIKAIWQYERIQKKICRQKMSIMFHEININEEMLPNIYISSHADSTLFPDFFSFSLSLSSTLAIRLYR